MTVLPAAAAGRLLLTARQAYQFARRVGALVLQRARRSTAYPALVRPWSPQVTIGEARMADLIEVQRRLRPGVRLPPQRLDPHLTRYVARAGPTLAGFVTLARLPREDAPAVGHWLNSLHVLTCYRRLGIGADRHWVTLPP